MEFSEESVGDVCVVSTQGRLDGATSTTFADRFAKLIGNQPNILIDFSGVDFVTSAGLRAVLSILKKVKSANGMLALCGVQPAVREILDITGLTPMMQIFASRSDGLAAMTK
jgi:anti-anti-sigma factor